MGRVNEARRTSGEAVVYWCRPSVGAGPGPDSTIDSSRVIPCSTSSSSASRFSCSSSSLWWRGGWNDCDRGQHRRLIVAILLVGYLVLALIFPEKF
ncbi:potassium-transporting ATPase subunit F [Peterkaempfera sp. SMS 1(5)a]|uniref:potassium-transporting ATPase subunit F n=1 Tax=Peterkaempfera podocarpi TaxID=3232308 RepID=UPI00366FF655